MSAGFRDQCKFQKEIHQRVVKADQYYAALSKYAALYDLEKKENLL